MNRWPANLSRSIVNNNNAFPTSDLAPLDYRFALDAAMSVLGQAQAPLVICNPVELIGEIKLRIPGQRGTSSSSLSSAALWVDPLADTWETDLNRIMRALSPDANLVTILSQPAARLIPERRGWSGNPLGFQLGGLRRLRHALTRAGFTTTVRYGIHSAFAVGLSRLSQLVGGLGRADLGDRLHFASRLNYCSTGPMAGLATVALLFSSREGAL